MTHTLKHTHVFTYNHLHKACQRQQSWQKRVKSGWQAASHGVLLTFSPIALSLLTLHAPPCCSDWSRTDCAPRRAGELCKCAWSSSHISFTSLWPGHFSSPRAVLLPLFPLPSLIQIPPTKVSKHMQLRGSMCHTCIENTCLRHAWVNQTPLHKL